MQYPLVCLTLFFCLGIACAGWLNPPFVPVYIAAMALFVLSIFWRRQWLRFKIALSCLVFLLGALWLADRLCLPRDHIARRIYYKTDNSCELKGFVKTYPLFRAGKTLFVVEAQEARFGRIKYRTRGGVSVTVKGRADLHYGDKLILNGKLFRPYRPAKSARLSSRFFAARMNVEGPLFITVTNHDGGSSAVRLAARFRDKARDVIRSYLPDMPAAVLQAMILGDRSGMPPVAYRSMMKSGLVHLMVVSGFYTGLVVFCVFFLLKLARVPRQWRLLAAMPVLFFNCLVTGASTPVIRASVMTVIFMFSYYVRRQHDAYNSCALAALVILFIEPRQLFDIGAQLSFASVLSIAYFYPRVRAFLRLDGKKPVFARVFVEGFLVSFSAWLGTVVLCAYYFRIVSPIAPIANMLIIPLAAMITYCGFALLAAAAFLPQAAPLFAASASVLVAAFIKLNAALVHLPGAYFYLPYLR